MKSILILFAHPRFEHSRVNKALIEAASKVEGVTIHDLYEHYPDFNIDIVHEQELLFGHEVVIWHHPFYWYSCPPLMKQWIDLVLEYNWAYGPKAFALKGKTALNAITAGGTKDVYCHGGRNNYNVSEFLRPFEQTARLCEMEYLPPFAAMGSHKMTNATLQDYQQQYTRLLHELRDGNSRLVTENNCEFLNDLDIINQKGER